MKNLPGILAFIILAALFLGCSNNTKTNEPAKTENKPTENKAENKAENKTETNKTASSSMTTADIGGDYKVNGAGLDGKVYSGDLSITKRDQVYQFSWAVNDEKYDGVGVQQGNALAVAYTTGTDGNGCGAIIYKINSDDSIEGKWGTWGVNESGTEKAVPTEKTTNNSGNFDVSGTNPNGSAYKGKLSVTRASEEIYQFSWDVGSKYIGTGVKVGEFLAAGSGPKQCGFVIYEIKDGKLEGKWGVPGTAKLGMETAVKK